MLRNASSLFKSGNLLIPKQATFRNSFLSTSQLSTLASSTILPEPSKGVPVSIKAYYISKSIDIHRIQDGIIYTSARREYQAKSVTISLSEVKGQYISVFKYGSVVLFNIPEENHSEHLKHIVEASGTTCIPIPQQQYENYRAIIHENLDKPSVIKAEHVNIRQLDLKNVHVIGTIMAQSVALDYFAIMVDRMLEQFSTINAKIQANDDNFSTLNAKELHKLIASNNAVITTVLSKMGLFEGIDAAWDNGDYYDTWNYLRKDFEIETRFQDLKLKLEIMKDDIRFFLEVLHNQKSTKLEWVIIILIGVEIVMGLFGHAKEYLN